MRRILNARAVESAMLWATWALAAAVWLKGFNQWSADYDLWMHLKVGEQILNDGTLFLIDRWSFTAPGARVVDHEWLVHIAMTALYRWGGDSGLMLWRGSFVLCIALGMIHLSRPGNRSRPGLVQPALLIAAAVVLAPGLSFRPQLITYLGLIFLLVLAHPSCGALGAWRWRVIVLVFWVWANSHGGFALGVVVWGWMRLVPLFSHPGQLKTARWWAASVVPVLATLATPHGIGLWQFIWQELSNPMSSRFITEWRPFSFAPREWPFFLWATGLVTMVIVRRCKISMMDMGFGVMAIGLGLASVRHSPLLPILTMPLAISLAGAPSRAKESSANRPSAGIASHAGVAMLIAMAAVFLGIRGAGAPWAITADRDPLPVSAVHLIKQNNISGSLWVPLHWGGYAAFHLHPKVKVSIDGRWAMVYPRSVMADHVAFDRSGENGDWKRILSQYGTQMALVAPDHPVAAKMVMDTDWVLIQKSNSAGLFFHRRFFETGVASLAPLSVTPLSWP